MKIKLNVVNGLIVINILVFILLVATSGDDGRETLISLFALQFPKNSGFSLWQIVTYLFLHGSVAHLLFNMYALFAFGSVLENKWGRVRFTQFYFVCGIGAALIYTLANSIQFNSMLNDLSASGMSGEAIQQFLNSGRVENSIVDTLGESRLREIFDLYHSVTIGASGAIYGILIAFALSYPQAKLFLIFLPIPISAKYFVPLLIAADVFFGITSYSVGNIAHFAHVGGALSGLLMMLWWRFRAAKFSQRF